MYVPDYDPKTKTGDIASLDVLYRKYVNAYNRAVKNAKRYNKDIEGEYTPGSLLLNEDDFREEIRKRAKDPEIAAKYKANKKGIEFLAEEMGKKDARQMQKGQAKAYLINKGIREEDITLHMLTATMYTKEDIWAQISLRYHNLKSEGKSGIVAKLIISSEFFGSD